MGRSRRGPLVRGRAEPAWDAVELVPAARTPDLPWHPDLANDEDGDDDDDGEANRRWWWIASMAAIPLSLTTQVSTWWKVALHGFLLVPLYQALRVAGRRLTVTADGIVISGVLLRRTISWAAIRDIEVRKYQVTADLGRHGRLVWRFDGRKGRPSASEVAGVLERMRRMNTAARPRYRVAPSWCAMVLLLGAAPIVGLTVVRLLGWTVNWSLW